MSGIATVLAGEEANDLSLLAVPVSQRVLATHVATTPPERGDMLWKVGYASGRLNVTCGPCLEVGDHLHLRAICRPGDSGGGLFDRSGSLAGVCTAYLTEQPHIGAGTGLGPIRRLLERVQWPACRKRGKRSGPDLGVPGVCPPSREPAPSAELVELKAQLARLQSEVEALKSRASVPGARGERGEPGTPGPRGPPGLPGKDADSNQVAQLQQELAELRKQLNNLSSSIRVRVEPRR